MIDCLIGGRLGDFIHSLVIPKQIYEYSGIKSKILIADKGDVFSNGLLNTYKELIPIMENQEYIGGFELYDSEIHKNIQKDLSTIRESPHLYTTCWNEILFKTYLPEHRHEVPQELSWLNSTKNIPELNDVILVNRAPRSSMEDSTITRWEEIFKNYEEYKFLFVCSDKNQYIEFEFGNIELLYCETLEEMVNSIGSCAMFVGNQSTPFAIASALNKPRVVELISKIDQIHYINDTKYYKNMTYFYGN